MAKQRLERSRRTYKERENYRSRNGRSLGAIPEGRYILFEAEQQGCELPNACRMGCCTKCAVKVTKGSLEQRRWFSERNERRGYAYF